MNHSLLQVDRVHKSFQSGAHLFKRAKETQIKAVDDVSFQVQAGESFGLVGESGSGKTTLANLILGIHPLDQGKIYFDGQDISNLSRKEFYSISRDLQMVFQDPYMTLDPLKTIGWSIQEPLQIHKMGSKKEQYQAVVETLNDVDLDESYYHRYPHDLSGGQLQRVAIAAAIILKPKLIIIDEGVSALDVSIQASVLNLLNELKDKYQLTYIFISHDLNVIQYFCDRVAVMYKSNLIEIFSPEDFQLDQLQPYTQELFHAIPRLYLGEDVQ